MGTEERRNGMVEIEGRMDTLETTVETNHGLILDALLGEEHPLTKERDGGMQADIKKALARQVTRRQVYGLIGSLLTTAGVVMAAALGGG